MSRRTPVWFGLAGLVSLLLAGFAGPPRPAAARLNHRPDPAPGAARPSACFTPQANGRAALVFEPHEIVTALAISPDGTHLAVAAGEAIYLYRYPALERLAVAWIGALTPGLVFSPTGALLAAGSRDGQVRLWRLAAGLESPAWQAAAHRKGTNTLAFSPDGARVASGGNDAVARLWDAASGERVAEIIGGTFAVPALAFAPGGETLAVANGGIIRLREPGSGRITGSLRVSHSLFNLAYSPDGRLLAGATVENEVLLWDPAQAYRTGSPAYPEPLALPGHAGRADTFHALVWDLAFSPDGRRLASAGGDGRVRLWGLPDGAALAAFPLPCGAPTSLAFTPDGRSLLVGGLDAAVWVWDL